MSLKIIVLVKQVPDTKNIGADAMAKDGTVNRSALPTITNPEDLNALEEALKIKETIGGTITVISLGPPLAVNALKECLYRGADDAILITDSKFAASDTLATSYALKCAIDKIGKYDLIFCGRQAIDGDTAQVGPQIAEKLNLNQITSVKEVIAITEKNITVRRVIDEGYEVLRSKLPVLVTVIAEANEPRFQSARLTMRYKNVVCHCDESYSEAYIHPEEGGTCGYVKQWGIDDIKANVSFCGLSGSPTKVKNIQNVVLMAKDTKMLQDNETDIGNLMRELIGEHIIG